MCKVAYDWRFEGSSSNPSVTYESRSTDWLRKPHRLFDFSDESWHITSLPGFGVGSLEGSQLCTRCTGLLHRVNSGCSELAMLGHRALSGVHSVVSVSFSLLALSPY